MMSLQARYRKSLLISILFLKNTYLEIRKLREKSKIIDSVHGQARDYSSKVKLGVYSKARIGNRFMWALKEESYEETLIE